MSDITVVCIGDGLVQPALFSLPLYPPRHGGELARQGHRYRPQSHRHTHDGAIWGAVC